MRKKVLQFKSFKSQEETKKCLLTINTLLTTESFTYSDTGLHLRPVWQRLYVKHTVLTLIILGWNRNRNDKQLELNACMLAPTPLLTCIHQPLSERGPVWRKQGRTGPPKWLSWLYQGLANQLTCWKLRLWWGWFIVRWRLFIISIPITNWSVPKSNLPGLKIT